MEKISLLKDKFSFVCVGRSRSMHIPLEVILQGKREGTGEESSRH